MCGFFHIHTVRSLHISHVVVRFFVDTYHDIVCITAFTRYATAKAEFGFLEYRKSSHISDNAL